MRHWHGADGLHQAGVACFLSDLYNNSSTAFRVDFITWSVAYVSRTRPDTADTHRKADGPARQMHEQFPPDVADERWNASQNLFSKREIY